MYKTPDGIPFVVKQDFLSEDELPILPAPGYPKIYLLDAEKSRLSITVASPTSLDGEWGATVNVPKLNIAEPLQLKVVWVFKEDDAQVTRVYEDVLVEPELDQRLSDIVVMDGEDVCTVTVASDATNLDYLYASLFHGNNLIQKRRFDKTEIRLGYEKLAIDMPVTDAPPSLAAGALLINLVSISGKKETRTFKFWKITPQIAVAMSHIEDQINKARLHNIIPELEYSEGDLLSALERGLYMFNAVGYTTGFDGTNMQGALLDGWLLCSSYYAMCAQHLAEGQLAFDFGGQGVSLNIDRTPSIDSFIGRLQTDINERVVPLKKQLSRQGIITGDGSIGAGSLRNPRNQVRLGMINAPTTFIPLTANTRFGGRRS